MMTDAAGQPLYAWDAEDRQFHFYYDELRRPLSKEVTEGSTTYVLEETVYGEGQTTPHLYNLRGQVYQQYDNAGMNQVDAYDFKGVPLSPKQQLLEDHTIVNVDWAGTPTLDSEVFTTSVTIDALGRPVTQTDAGGNVTEYSYDKAGALKTVEVNTDGYVNDIHYNARGQREAIWYGNGTKTAYTYDDKTYRLIRLLTTKSSNIYQDLQYWYDPVGNITQIQDDAQQTLYYSGSVVAPDQDFTYDALYRLITAEGRELIGTATFGANDNIDDAAWQTSHIGNGAAVQNYTQSYEYDAVGNILELQHAATAGSYTRTYDYDVASNRLDSTEVGVTTYSYTYDDRGNMLTMPHLPTMVWNAQNELQHTGDGTGTVNTYFNYSGGQRIRKVCLKPGRIREERIYMGSYELYRKYVNGVLTVERTTVHVSDDSGRIAMLEERTVGSDSAPATLQRYIYSNHLSTASLELDENAAIISYEEYHPYGTTSYQAMNASINAVAKRYRYTGKERDEETGLYYHGARYYIPWLCRWSAVDPMESKYAGQSPYNYGFNNPITWQDANGMDPAGGDGEQTEEEKKAAAESAQSKTVQGYVKKDESEALYKFTNSVYDSKGNLTETTTFGFNEIEGLPHGEYKYTKRDPYRSTVKDGNITYFVKPTETFEYTPFETESGESGSSVGTRIWGGVKLVGGILEMVGGAVVGIAGSETGIGIVIGWAAIVHGADVAQAGFSQMFSGGESQTFTQQGISAGLQTAGVSEENAEYYSGYGDAALSMALGMGRPTSSPAIVKSTPTKVDYLFKDKGEALNWARKELGHNTTKMFDESGKLIGWQNQLGNKVYWGHGDWYKGLGSSTFPHLNYNINGVKGHLFLENKIINSNMIDDFNIFFSR